MSVSAAPWAGAVAAAPPSVGARRVREVPSTLIARMQSRIQIAATTTVIRVNRSPALVPKAL